MAMISILTIIGILSLILGFWSILYVNRFIKSGHAFPNWKKLRAIVLLIGLILGVLSWPGTFFMGYPLSSGGETVRVVGIPFIVAYFDSNGRDYVGSLTLLSVIGNVAFWFLFPHIFFAIITKYRKRHINTQ